MENYKNKLGNLADKLKQERPATPIQEVIPVKTVPVPNEPEVQFNNRIPKGLLKRLKTFGLEYDESLKDINIQALELYLGHKMKPEETTTNAK
jgi:hypothetical protein